jgi:DnaJ-class molecular chaperone
MNKQDNQSNDSNLGLSASITRERNELAAKLECPDCNGGGLVKGSNEYEWETYLEPCETCNGDGYVADQWAIKA